LRVIDRAGLDGKTTQSIVGFCPARAGGPVESPVDTQDLFVQGTGSRDVPGLVLKQRLLEGIGLA